MKLFIKIAVLLFPLFAFTGNSGYQVGDVAEGFNLKNIDGATVSLNDYPNGAIVIFTCNTCPVAKAYEQRILELDKKYKFKGYPVIAINPNDVSQSPGDSFDEMKKRASQKKYTFPYLIDEDQSVTRKFGATRTPHVFILENTSGKHYVRYIGAIDNNQNGNPDTKFVEDALESLLQGKKPQTSFTKAVGCGIKFKKTT